jgi:hypothetical protein
LEAKKMLRNPTNVSNVIQCSKIEPQSGKWYICINCNQTELTLDGIEWQVTGTNVLPNDKNPIVHVEYFALENVQKVSLTLSDPMSSLRDMTKYYLLQLL